MEESSNNETNRVSAVIPDYIRVILITDMNGRKRQLYIPAALDLDRPKRPRTIFTESQLQILEGEFEKNHFVSDITKHALSTKLDLTDTQIKVWFQNRRTKLKRQEESSTTTDSISQKKS